MIESMWLMISGKPSTPLHRALNCGYCSSVRALKKATSPWTIANPLRNAANSPTSRKEPSTAPFFRNASISTKLPSGSPLSIINTVRISKT